MVLVFRLKQHAFTFFPLQPCSEHGAFAFMLINRVQKVSLRTESVRKYLSGEKNLQMFLFFKGKMFAVMNPLREVLPASK